MLFDNQLYTLLFCIRCPAIKINKEPRTKLFKKINISVLSHNTFWLEDDDYKAVDSNGETISFNCQLIKKKEINGLKFYWT